MGQHSRILDRFEYHVEDLLCKDCSHRIKKSERVNPKLGCGGQVCRYSGLLVEAIINGRIQRKRGHFTCQDYLVAK